MRRTALCVLMAASLAAAAGSSALAADAPKGSTRDLNEYSCKDVMRLSGQDRDVALALTHGYVLGKKGTTKFEVDALAGITDKFIDYCLDNPKANALEAFERIAR